MLQDYTQISAVVTYPNLNRISSSSKKQEKYSISSSSSGKKVSMEGPVVSILWDMENCPVPGDVSADDVAGNIRMAIRVHPAIQGIVTMFSAYGDFNHFPRRLREGCQRTGINLIDVPNGKKDASDKAILVDMFLFALDNPPPCTILLISGDVDFAPALHKLGQRGYSVVLAIPAGTGVSSALCNAGRYVWDWPSVARGEGFVPAKAFLAHALEERLGSGQSHNFSVHGIAWQSSDDSDHFIEEECNKCILDGSGNGERNKCVVGNGDERNKFVVGANGNDERKKCVIGGSSKDGRNKCLPNSDGHDKCITNGDERSKCIICNGNEHSASIIDSNALSGDFAGLSLNPHQRLGASSVATSSRNQIPLTSFGPSHQKNEVCELSLKRKLAFSSNPQSLGSSQIPITSETNNVEDASSWVQPGDLEGLKSQLINLLKSNGGELPFVRVPSEYCKLYGRPLYLSEYGSVKLAHLIQKMQDAFVIEGDGGRRKLCLREAIRVLQRPISENNSMCDMKKNNAYKEARTPVVTPVVKDLDMLEEVILLRRKNDKEELDERTVRNDEDMVRLEVFKQELQELLVSHACRIPLITFLRLYRQRYSHELDLMSLHVDNLEMLFEKVKDVVLIKEEQETKRKFIVARCADARC